MSQLEPVSNLIHMPGGRPYVLCRSWRFAWPAELTFGEAEARCEVVDRDRAARYAREDYTPEQWAVYCILCPDAKEAPCTAPTT